MLTTENLKCFSQYALVLLFHTSPCLLSPKQERTIAVNKYKRPAISLSKTPTGLLLLFVTASIFIEEGNYFFLCFPSCGPKN